MPSFAQSPQPYVRACGAMYLAIIALGIFGEVVVRGAVPAAGAAAFIAANETLWRAGIAGDLLMHVLDVPVMVVLYLLLRPTSAPLALLATAFNVVQTAILAANKSTLLIPLLVTGRAAFEGAPVDGIARLALQWHAYGFAIGLVFFGFACIVRGWLLRASGLVPGWLGALLVVAGACYLLNSFALLLAPSLARSLFPWVLLPAFLAELALALWLLVRGVDLSRWRRA